MNTKKILDEIEYQICNQQLTKEQVFTKMKNIIQMLERSNNSDYAVQPTASPKLPSFEVVKENMIVSKCGSIEEDVYNTLKKLGNFA